MAETCGDLSLIPNPIPGYGNSSPAGQLAAASIDEFDPRQPDPDFPFSVTYFPLGYPLQVVSNSSEVMEAAEQSWRHCRQIFARKPLQLRIGVSDRDEASVAPPPAPSWKLQWNILSTIGDAYNFVIADLSQGRSFGWVTPLTARSPLYLRYHILEAAALSMVATLRAAPLHAACVSWLGQGILLCGESGAGKSTLAYACARQGWTFTSDDASYLPLDRDDRLVVGNSHQVRFRSSAAHLFTELAGRPVTPRAAGKPSIEVLTEEFPGMITSDSSEVDYIVFLNRRNVSRAELVPVSGESVLPSFERSLITSVETGDSSRSALRRLLTAATFELRYTDLQWAVERLQLLAVTGQ